MGVRDGEHFRAERRYGFERMVNKRNYTMLLYIAIIGVSLVTGVICGVAWTRYAFRQSFKQAGLDHFFCKNHSKHVQ